MNPTGYFFVVGLIAAVILFWALVIRAAIGYSDGELRTDRGNTHPAWSPTHWAYLLGRWMYRTFNGSTSRGQQRRMNRRNHD